MSYILKVYYANHMYVMYNSGNEQCL